MTKWKLFQGFTVCKLRFIVSVLYFRSPTQSDITAFRVEICSLFPPAYDPFLKKWTAKAYWIVFKQLWNQWSVTTNIRNQQTFWKCLIMKYISNGQKMFSKKNLDMSWSCTIYSFIIFIVTYVSLVFLSKDDFCF